MDGITLNPGSGGKTVDTVELDSGRQVERIQLAFIIDGVAVPVDEDNPLPIRVIGGVSGSTQLGCVGKSPIPIGDADHVLTTGEAAKGLISITSTTMTAPRFVDFPAVADDTAVYSRIVRTECNQTVTIRSGLNTFDMSTPPGQTSAQMILTFESDRISSANTF